MNSFGFYGFSLLHLCKVGEHIFIFTKCIKCPFTKWHKRNIWCAIDYTQNLRQIRQQNPDAQCWTSILTPKFTHVLLEDPVWSKQFKTTPDLEIINCAPLSSLSNQMLFPRECTLQFSPEKRFALFLGLFFSLFSKIATEQLFHQGSDHSVPSLYDSHLCLLLRMKTTWHQKEEWR